MAGKLTDMNLPRFPRLSDDEVRLLIQAAQEGNNEARERMVHCNLRLVFHLVQRFANRGYDLEDLPAGTGIFFTESGDKAPLGVI